MSRFAGGGVCPRGALRAGLAVIFALAGAAAPATAFEFFDGRVSLHGFFETQIRSISKEFDTNDDVDLSQWYNILNLELEAEIAPDGIGPFDLVEAFVRVEARYDCVWKRACWLFPSVDTYGNRTEHLPKRLINGRLNGQHGALKTFDTRRYSGLNRENFTLAERDNGRASRSPLSFGQLPGIVQIFRAGDGANNAFEPTIDPNPNDRIFFSDTDFGDDTPFDLFDQYLRGCKWTAQRGKGGENGGLANPLGPWNPGCKIRHRRALNRFANPWNENDNIRTLAGPDRIPNTGDELPDPGRPGQTITTNGRGELPFRPAPRFSQTDRTANKFDAQGIYYPSKGYRRALKSLNFKNIDQNYSQTELSWNRGQAQKDEKELKEAYLDLEAFEGRLWLRLGKQSIVWGKTELFRTTDQFNPQDLALNSLPNLEESRVALWSARGTWSFYDIGPLEDVRLELAFNFDDFEQADIGVCGEPYAVDLICQLSFGYVANGLAGAGIGGHVKPQDPWDDTSGIEVGARVEFRWGRFSFQISNFYGYEDFPWADRITTYERNVDPLSGRPRNYLDRRPCPTGDEGGCLGLPSTQAVALDATGYPLRDVDGAIFTRGTPGYNTGDLLINPDHRALVLLEHHANQQAFAFGSGSLQGQAGTNVDPALSGFGTFNGKGGPGSPLSTVANGASALLAGSAAAALSAFNQGFIPTIPPLTQINQDVNDLINPQASGGLNPGAFTDGADSLFSLIGDGLGQRLTIQQEALMGCGPFYSADCDTDGVDFLNAEASVLLQSFPGIDGTFGSVDDFDTADTSFPQPGTFGFVGGPIATRVADDGSGVVQLPGSRGPDDPGWDPGIDGCVRSSDPGCAAAMDLEHGVQVVLGVTDPQIFRSELAAVSYNLMMVTAARSDPLDPDNITFSEFDPDQPFREDGCSFRKPAMCDSVNALFRAAGVSARQVRAAGNRTYGRRDFAWHQSGQLALRYEKRNVLGFAFDFAEDVLKTNWGVEATWIEGQRFSVNNNFKGTDQSDTYNVSISVDRPTFINFLNQNRTFLFNTQWFFQYIGSHDRGYTTQGPFNALFTFTIFTGYFQDRMLLFWTSVYDFRSESGAFLPSITYRFTENFSATLGMNWFWGSSDLVDSPLNEIRPVNRTGRRAYKDEVFNGLSALDDREEARLTIRYTF